MKKYLNYSLSYGVMGLVCGVYFREFTKVMGFSNNSFQSPPSPLDAGNNTFFDRSSLL